MIRYAIAFMIIALIAGGMGFGLVGGMAYGAAKICFFIVLPDRRFFVEAT